MSRASRYPMWPQLQPSEDADWDFDEVQADIAMQDWRDALPQGAAEAIGEHSLQALADLLVEFRKFKVAKTE